MPVTPLRPLRENLRVNCAVGTGEIEGEGGKGDRAKKAFSRQNRGKCLIWKAFPSAFIN